MRYYSLNEYYKKVYGEKVGKLGLSVFKTCPNRDGTLGSQACRFCSDRASGDFNFEAMDIGGQIQAQKSIAKSKWKVNKFIAYFQSFTNTYARIDLLDKAYGQALEDQEIVGLNLATRADCLGRDVLNLLLGYNKITRVCLEIGMQTIKEESIVYINRGYSHDYLDKKLQELKQLKLDFVLHIIVGLPGESLEDIDLTIDYINRIKPRGIKIHNLYVQKDSPIYLDYKAGLVPHMTKDAYTDIVVRIISRLDPEIVVERLTGDGNPQTLVYPMWSKNKLGVIGEINKKLNDRQIIQGIKKTRS